MTPLTPAEPAPLAFRRGVDLTAVTALFAVTLRSLCRVRRLLCLAVVFALPVLIAGLQRAYEHEPRALPRIWYEVELVLVFMMIPHLIIPLTSLLFAAGMIQDEIEDQTLTYLLTRPLPRWALYLTKLAAAILVAAALAAVFTTVTMAVIWYGRGETGTALLRERLGPVLALHAAAVACYTGVFGLLSLLVRRTLVIGVVYSVLLEGVVANVPFVVRQLTVMYYFRVLAARWLALEVKPWRLDLAEAPDAAHAIGTLAAGFVAVTALAIYLFHTREFRVKTPEGG